MRSLQEKVKREQEVSSRLDELTALEGRSRDEILGLITPGLDDTDGRDDRNTISEEERALAFSGWCAYQMDEDVSQRQIEACRRVGMRLNQKKLKFRLGGPSGTSNYRSMLRDYRSVAHHAREERMRESRAMTTFAVANGGALVPETFVRSLELNMLAFGGVRQVAETMFTSTGERIAWPTADDTSNQGVLLGESQPIGASTEPSFGMIYWDAYKFSSKPVLVPYELLQDSFIDLPGLLGQMLGERIGRVTATYHTTGDGANKPKGIITNAVVGVTAGSATTITYDEVIQLEHSVDPAYRNGAEYMFHDNLCLHFRLLKDGNGQYLWQNGANAMAPDRINGRPYTISMEMASAMAASAKTVLFGQLSRHKIRRVGEARLYRLEERYRDNDQDGFVLLLREDSNTLKTGTEPIKYLQQAA
ncbi:MAG: phage major capsid protein [Verrucomicrobiae bacterium]|nr:phage major capsid protein [Verrucomicrobiae bacterium]